MSDLNFRTLPFNSSDDEFELLYELENTLDYHVKAVSYTHLTLPTILLV